MSRAVLAVVSSKQCRHCMDFYRDTWPELSSELKNISGIEVVEIKLETLSSPLDTSKYPSGLSKYLKWFPMLILVPTASYQQGLLNKDAKINPVIMNGKANDSGVEYSNEGYRMDKASILRWINTSLEKPQFVNTPQNPTTSIKPLVSSGGGRGKMIVAQGGDVCGNMVVKGW